MNKTELKATAERIIETLPRAHYLKAKTIEVTLSASAPTSYFNPVDFSITIALDNIASAIKGKAASLTEAELEATIRALCYHEISHAMLTPKNAFKYGKANGIDPQMVNIIEDERIETLLAHYYHGVDFKANARAIIEYRAPRNFEEWVFYGLRIRKAPFGLKEMLKAFGRFLKKTAKINACGSACKLASDMNALLTELREIYEAKMSEGDPEEGDPEAMAQNEEQAEETMAAACLSAKKHADTNGSYSVGLSDYAADKEAKVGMLKAIIRNQGIGVAAAPTIGGYNGKFSVQRYIKDQHLTLKWFDKKLDGGEREARKAQKKTLNIWLDQSGSFAEHDATINGILKALSEIENSRDDFEWRLIRMDEHFVIERDAEKRTSHSHGGNALPKSEIAKCYAETNGTSTELNIVLFDGQTGCSQALINRYYGDGAAAKEQADRYSYDNLKVLDNRRTIFITERDNTDGIKEACPNARDVIEENSDYEGRLTANIVRAFDLLF